MGRQPWSDRLTAEECRSLNIADLVRSGLFSHSSPQTQYFSPRGLDVSTTCLAPTVVPVSEWVWNGRSHEKAPIIGNRITLSYKRGRNGSELMKIPESEGGGQALCIHAEQNIEQEVEIVSITSPLQSGRRYYFICSGVNGLCGRRVGKLYLPPRECQFACRNCYNLTYRSTKEHNKRLDDFRRLPPEALTRALNSPDWNTRFLAFSAALRLRLRMARR